MTACRLHWGALALDTPRECWRGLSLLLNATFFKHSYPGYRSFNVSQNLVGILTDIVILHKRLITSNKVLHAYIVERYSIILD